MSVPGNRFAPPLLLGALYPPGSFDDTVEGRLSRLERAHDILAERHLGPELRDMVAQGQRASDALESLDISLEEMSASIDPVPTAWTAISGVDKTLYPLIPSTVTVIARFWVEVKSTGGGNLLFRLNEDGTEVARAAYKSNTTGELATVVLTYVSEVDAGDDPAYTFEVRDRLGGGSDYIVTHNSTGVASSAYYRLDPRAIERS